MRTQPILSLTPAGTRCFTLLILLSTCAVYDHAQSTQSYPKFDVFGGYSFKRNVNFFGGGGNGWEASGTYNFNRWLGITTDFAGHYESKNRTVGGLLTGTGMLVSRSHEHEFLLGPRFTIRKKQASFFLHALIGGVHVNESEGFRGSFTDHFSRTSLAFATGGGTDWKLSQRTSWRVIQIDYIRHSAGYWGGRTQNDIRVGSGVVFGFGGK